MIKDALELIDGIVNHSPELVIGGYSGLIKELCMMGYTSVGCAMMEAVLEMGLNLDNVNFVNLIKGFLKEQKVSEALGLFDILLNKNTTISADLYQLMLPKLLRFDNVERAIGLAQYVQRKQLGYGTSIYSNLVEELCRIGKTKDAIFILQEMLVNKMPLDKNMLNALLQSYSQENNWRKAQEVLCIMVRMHTNLSISGYRSLLWQFGMHYQFYNVLRLKELIEIESKSKELILCNILIFHLFRAGDILLVKRILKDMEDRDITLDEVGYNFLVYGFYKCQNVKMAVETLNILLAKGLRPSTRSLRIMISHFCRQGNIDKALELYNMIERNNWNHGIVIENTIALSLLSIGRHCEAELLLDRINGREVAPAQVNYDLLIKEFCVKGGMDKAVDLLNKMLKKGNLPSEISYSSIIQKLCIYKEFDRALDFFAEMQYNNLKPSKESCNALICGLCDSGRVDEARGLLETMLQIGVIPTHTMYNYVIDKYHANNNLNKAAELLDEMQRAGYSPNFETHWSIISNLSSNSNKKKIGESGGSLLSSLLFGAGLKEKNNEDTSSSRFKYASFFST
uniref:Pentatricopeptide repeat-containing protein n=1 Tax=Ananas comosus var. bracteatus TaxID=296719 RepID=A0A6V7QVF6_ANACO